MSLRTPLCDLLGIDYPIVQSGMGGVAGPELVAEVSKAGGLGIIAGLELPPDRVREAVRAVRRLTDRPFGVNLWLHSEMRPPIDMSSIPEARVRSVQNTLNGFRERLGLPATQARPSWRSASPCSPSRSAIRAPTWSAAATSATSRSSR